MTLSRGWFFLPRVPELEAMESGEEAEAYSSAAAQTHLDHLDNTFVDHVLSLGVRSGLALDVGTGPGQIPIKLALKLPQLEIVGIDLSEAMLAKARNGAAAAGLESQVRFETGDARRLPFADHHHFEFRMFTMVLFKLRQQGVAWSTAWTGEDQQHAFAPQLAESEITTPVQTRQAEIRRVCAGF